MSLLRPSVANALRLLGRAPPRGVSRATMALRGTNQILTGRLAGRGQIQAFSSMPPASGFGREEAREGERDEGQASLFEAPAEETSETSSEPPSETSSEPSPAAPSSGPNVSPDVLENYQALGGRRTAAGRAALPPQTTLFVGNIIFDLDEAELSKFLDSHGPPPLHFKLARDARGLSKGFGFVEYRNKEEAAEARKAIDLAELRGRLVYASFADNAVSNKVAVRPHTPSSVVFVGNLPHTVTDRDLTELLRKVPKVTACRLAIDRKTGQPRGFMHLEFASVDDATVAKLYLASKSLLGRALRVDYAQKTTIAGTRRASGQAGQGRKQGREQGQQQQGQQEGFTPDDL